MPVTFLTCSACCLSPRRRHDRRVSRPAAAGCLRPPAAARWRGGGGLPVARGGCWRVGARSRWKRPFDFPILLLGPCVSGVSYAAWAPVVVGLSGPSPGEEPGGAHIGARADA